MLLYHEIVPNQPIKVIYSIELILFLLFFFPSKLDGCLVTLVHNDSDVDDEESLLLWKQLCYVAHMELHVRGLSSGYCKDVHGQVSRIKPMIEFLL